MKCWLLSFYIQCVHNVFVHEPRIIHRNSYFFLFFFNLKELNDKMNRNWNKQLCYLLEKLMKISSFFSFQCQFIKKQNNEKFLMTSHTKIKIPFYYYFLCLILILWLNMSESERRRRNRKLILTFSLLNLFKRFSLNLIFIELNIS